MKMLTEKEYNDIEAILSDIYSFSELIKEETLRKFTKQDLQFICKDSSTEFLKVLLNRLKNVEEFEMCQHLNEMIEDRKKVL